MLYCDKALAMDTIHSNVPAIFGGETIAQFYVGLTTQVCNAYGIKSEKQFVNTLEDIIRERGAPNKLVSDSAQVEISERVKDILRTLVIADWQSTPHEHQQNPAERQCQTVLHLVNLLMPDGSYWCTTQLVAGSIKVCVLPTQPHVQCQH